MGEDPRLSSFLTRLRSQVVAETMQEEFETDDVAVTMFQEAAFTEVVLGFLEDHGQITDAEICYVERRMGRGIGKTNAWHLDDDAGVVTLITTLFRGMPEPSSITATEITQAIERAVRVFTEAQNAHHLKMEPASCAFDMMERLYGARESVNRIRVVVLGDGFAADLGQVPFGTGTHEVTVDVWDMRRLFRVDSSGLPYEPIEIDLNERLGHPLASIASPSRHRDFDVYLTVLPASLLHELYHDYGPRILELNVRSFLQARGKVNRGIRDTLRNEPAHFIAYNNGISATAESVELVVGPGGTAISRLRGLQIVNGGQTVASIHRAKERDRQDLSDVFVQAKVTIVKPEHIDSLVPQISRYANTQNRVSEADFSANHPFHVELQKLSKTVWSPGQQSQWFYERARGQYEVAQQREGSTPARLRLFRQANPPQQKFDKVKLAQYVNTWNQLPHVVSRGGQKNFLAFMQRLQSGHGEDWVPDAQFFRSTIGMAIIYKHAERIARIHKLPGYRANAITYTVSLVSYRTAGRIDLESIWNEQSLPMPLADTIHDWMPHVFEALVESAGGRNVTEWCKKEDCWRHLQTLGVVVSEGLQEALSKGQPLPTVGRQSSRGAEALLPEDRENIARVMQTPAEAWVQIIGWGSRAGTLQAWQSGIATTLASYAASGWNRVPSKKQALHGVKILKLAQEEGAFAIEDWE